MMSFLLFISSIFALTNAKCPKFVGYESMEEFRVKNDDIVVPGMRVDLTDAMNSDGAMCLDGSVGVFYFRKGSGDGLNKFHVFLEGGGACAGIEDQVIDSFDSCADRATTPLGSSDTYPAIADYDGDYMSTDKDTNPLTYNWNTVYVKYCDGCSFSGNNEDTVKVNDDLTLYFRGFRILQGVFDELSAKYGYNNASDLLVSGCSAGGVATYLHADYIYHNKLPQPTHMGAMPDSGFILEYEGKGKLMTGLKWDFDNMNVTASLNQDCLAAQEKGYEYLCMYAQETAPFSFVNMFALQSQYDSWQTDNMLVSDNKEEINAYGKNLTATIMNDYATGSKHAIFLDSCAHHCGYWDQIEIDGYLANRAQYEWYNQDSSHGPVYYQNDTYPCDACCTPN